MHLIEKYFPELPNDRKEKIAHLYDLYSYWNERINVISRKDVEHLFERHILHSLSIALFFTFHKGLKVADIGTGGGFPGIPLSIIFPESNFTLIDSIAKKIKVVEEIKRELKLENVEPIVSRCENTKRSFDCIVSRAVTSFPEYYSMVRNNLNNNKTKLPRGIIYLKGGDFESEIVSFKDKVKVYDISDIIKEEFFQTKKIIHLQE